MTDAPVTDAAAPVAISTRRRRHRYERRQRLRAAAIAVQTTAIVVALIVWLVLTSPDTAAGILRNIAAVLETAAQNITRFFTQLF